MIEKFEETISILSLISLKLLLLMTNMLTKNSLNNEIYVISSFDMIS